MPARIASRREAYWEWPSGRSACACVKAGISGISCALRSDAIGSRHLAEALVLCVLQTHPTNRCNVRSWREASVKATPRLVMS